MPLTSIKQGESFDFSFDLDGEDISGWTCTITLKQYPDDTASVNREITATDDKWTGFLTRLETKDLSVGQYTLTATMLKAATNEKDQQNERFYVSRGW